MPVFFEKSGNTFIGTDVSKSPWDETALNGVLIGGLFGHLFEHHVDFTAMSPGRLSIDILRPVPLETEWEVRLTRPGKNIQMFEATLHTGGEVHAKAYLSCIRKANMPAFHSPGVDLFNHPLPAEVKPRERSTDYSISPAIHSLSVIDPLDNPGHGVVWMNFHYDMLEGVPVTPFVQACMMADMGHGTSRALDMDHWLFINIDLNIVFNRMPQTSWQLIDARMESHGGGNAIAHSRFADENGFFAMGLQSLFIDKR
ncbi:MAG: acyl-CoA thioesterase domain-containing protein [Parvibaculales bacterium]